MDSSNPVASGTQRFLPWAVIGWLLALIAIVYGQTLTFGFIGYDDPAFVFDNPKIRGGLTVEGMIWAFTSGPFGEWYPLAMISHMIDCQLFGLDARWHHLTSVLLHAATAIGLFLVLRSMTRELWPSAMVATIFAIHPQHVESVVWIAERRDVLSGLFFVLTLAAYLGYVRNGRTLGRYLLVALALTLGLLAKSMLVTVPALLMVLDYWPLVRFGQAAALPPGVPVPQKQSFWSLVIEKLPLALIVLADAAITVSTHSLARHAVSLPWLTRLATMLVSTSRYLLQFFFPIDLVICYPYPTGGFPLWQLATSVAVLTAITEAVTSWRKERPYLLVGWLWFVGMLLPVSGLVSLSQEAMMADRYTYLPTIGLSMAVVWGARYLAIRLAAPRWALPACALLVAGLLTIAAVRQTSIWRSDESLWRNSLALTVNNAEAEVGLGDALLRKNKFDEALEHYRRATELQINVPLLTNMGIALLSQGNPEEAATQFRRALEIEPLSARLHDSLGSALFRQNELEEASEQFLLAIKIDRQYARAWYHLAQLLEKQGKTDQAIVHFERAIEAEPRLADAHREVAALLAARGQVAEAIAHYRVVLSLFPDDTATRAALEKLLRAQKGKTAK